MKRKNFFTGNRCSSNQNCCGCRMHLADRAIPVAATDQVVTFVMRRRDEFLILLENAIKTEAEKQGYTFRSVDAMFDMNKQIQAVKNAAKNGEKFVIVALVDSSRAREILDAAGSMKVVFINNPPSNGNILSSNAIYVGSDEAFAGKLQGEWLANYFQARQQHNITYLLLEGFPGLISEARTKGALQALADNGIQATAAAEPIVANYNRTEAMTKIYSLIQSGVKFDAIIANNDAMALGAVDALEQLGMDPSRTPIVGVDATYEGLHAVQEGQMVMTVVQNAEAQGSTAVIAGINLLEGKPITETTGYAVAPGNPYMILIPFETVDLENVGTYI